MKKFMLLVILAGCASPAADYVRADKVSWDQYDVPLNGKPLIDAWVDRESTFDDDTKEAYHLLNTSRRARVAHAIAAVGT